MFRIISNSREMSDLYAAWTGPIKITNARMALPAGADVNKEIIEYVKMEIANKLFEDIKGCIIYDIDSNNGWLTQVTGSIYVGIKNKE